MPDTSDGNPETFWKALLETENPITETFDKIYKRDRGIGAKAREKIDEAILLHVQQYADSIKYNPVLDSIAENALSYYCLLTENSWSILEGRWCFCRGDFGDGVL